MDYVSREKTPAKKLNRQDGDFENCQLKAIDWSVIVASNIFPEVTSLEATSPEAESSVFSLMNKWYLQGDYRRLLKYYRENKYDAVTTISFSFYVIAAAISSGDFEAYDEITSILKQLEHEYSSDTSTKKVIELCLSIAPICAYVTSYAPEWIKEGDFSDLPSAFLFAAVFFRVKYLMATGQCSKALGIAETALSYESSNQEISVHDINYRLSCAATNDWMGHTDKSLSWLTETVDLCLSNGITTPLSDTLADYGGRMEGYVKKQYPEHLDALIAQSEQAMKNWTAYYNLVSETSLTELLTLREIRIARRAATKIPYSRIASDAGVSIGNIKNTMQTIYNKLHINNRDELRKFVIPENLKLRS